MSLYTLVGNPQEITLQAASVATTSVLGNTNILLQTSTDIYIALGKTPTAVADGNVCHFVGEGTLLPLAVKPGDKLAVIPADAGGIGGKVRLSPLG
jgi:hypothetical protein